MTPVRTEATLVEAGLRAEIRLLGQLLGDTLREHEGVPPYELEESVRNRTKALPQEYDSRDEAALVWGADPRFLAVDYGDDRFTRGRPHPMIDNTIRLEAVRRAEGLLYLDVVLGSGAHPDPAAELAPALAGRPAVVVLVGTDGDPQGLARQRAAFEAAGATAFLSNSRAARSLVA